MPNFYDIAENARRRNRSNLRPGADINYEYGPFGANAQNSAPAGWAGQTSFIPGDYYVPPGLQQDPEFNPYENEDANQFWYEEADPTKKYTSHAAALEVTGGDPEMERKVALLNYQAAEKKRGEQQKMAMAIMQEQRMREKNWLTARNQQASRVAQQQRYDAADSSREADARNNAIWKAGMADPKNRETYLRQFTGTPAEINAFDLSMNRAAEKYNEADAAKSYRENTNLFESSKAAVGRGDYQTFGEYGITKGQLRPWQETELLGAARNRDRIAEHNARTGKANVGVMSRAEANMLSPDFRLSTRAKELFEDEGGDWTAAQKMAFRRDKKNYDVRDRAKVEKAIKAFDDAYQSSFAPGGYPTVTKNSSGEWVAIWEKGRTEGGKVVPEGHRWEDDLFQPAPEPEGRRGPTAEQINARREAYIEARRKRAIEKQANIDETQANSEAYRKQREAYKESIMTDEDRVARDQEDAAEEQRAKDWQYAVEKRAKADELYQAKFRLDNPDHPATQRVYQADPDLYKRDLSLVDVEDVSSARRQDDDEWFGTAAPTAHPLASRSGPDPFGFGPMTAEEEAQYIEFLEETNRGQTTSTNMLPAVVTQTAPTATATNVPSAVVTAPAGPTAEQFPWFSSRLNFSDPARWDTFDEEYRRHLQEASQFSTPENGPWPPHSAAWQEAYARNKLEQAYAWSPEEVDRDGKAASSTARTWTEADVLAEGRLTQQAAPATLPQTVSTNMPSAVVAQTETNVPPAGVAPRDTTGLLGVTPQVWARLAGSAAVKIAEEYAEEHPGEDPMNEGTAMILAIKRLKRTHYPIRN